MILPLINSSGEHRLLNTQDIAYLQTNGQGKLHFYSNEGISRPMILLKDWAMLLEKEGFVQIDRGTIVNMGRIGSVDADLHVVTIPFLDSVVSIPFAERMRRRLEAELGALKRRGRVNVDGSCITRSDRGWHGGTGCRE